MLELEVVPERSIGCEHWEFILGRLFLYNLKQWKNSPSKEWEWNNLQLIMIVTGMQFSQAVCIMQNQVAVMKRVQVIYNENVSNFFTPPFFMEIINIFFYYVCRNLLLQIWCYLLQWMVFTSCLTQLLNV